ncbi:MAG: hypothetical protein G01um101413_316 [Parcubacteria group bacterium Gr01-1014_13]|nr:MAG: hypothetical protein G01um101413_316 [Parcubacteria group bacterium Gr01-1014_13]
MSFNKKRWFFPLLALAEFIVILFLIPTDCGRTETDKNLSNIKETDKLTKKGKADQFCEGDKCPSLPNDNDADDEANTDEVDNVVVQDAGIQSCSTAEDCGCGYGCTNNKCHKLASACCVEGDCGAGTVCVKKEDQLNGECMISQCDTDNQCGGRCGVRCENHRCSQTYCCADSDCSTGKFCHIESDQTEGVCLTSQCNSYADCECNEACEGHICRRTYYSEKPMKCCGTDFYYEGACRPIEWIQNGRCLGDEHCPAGKACSDNNICLPTTCANNADCGCETVCRKGRCFHGCDKNSDCCNKGNVCDRGQCIPPDTDE